MIIVAALGGMVVPAAIYAAVNLRGEGADGWGIPMAADIALALGVLRLVGPRVPLGLKVFLAALAIADDLGAVVVIALFYTGRIEAAWLLGTGGCFLLLLAYNRLRPPILSPYLLVGAALWYFTFRSGVHATVAGVLLALTYL